MKKVFIIFLMCLFSTLSYSQKFSISVGANMANATVGTDWEELFTDLGTTKNGILGISGSFLTSFEINSYLLSYQGIAEIKKLVAVFKTEKSNDDEEIQKLEAMMKEKRAVSSLLLS